MNDRIEPAVFATAGRGKSWFGKPEATHTELLNDALAGFTAAQEKMDSAIATITRDITNDEAEAAAIVRRVAEKNESLSRLDRVKQRLENLLS